MGKRVKIEVVNPHFDTSKWGPEKHGLKVVVNPTSWPEHNGPWVFDVEDTGEDDGNKFVGVGLYNGGDSVYFFTELQQYAVVLLENSPLVAHNGKYDLHRLKQWGIKVKPEQLVFDTMLASYVSNSTKESHGLKDLAHTELGITYPSYADLTGKGAKAKKLSDIPPAVVAAYNGMDVFTTYKLWKLYEKLLTKEQASYFHNIEMPICRLLFKMEELGVGVDAKYLSELDSSFALEGARHLDVLRRVMERNLRGLAGPIGDRMRKLVESEEGRPNPSSSVQVKHLLLQAGGISVESTGKEALEPYSAIPLVQVLQRYREVTKLRSTYTTPLLRVRDESGRIRTTFNQCSKRGSDYADTWGGIRTGRLSSSDPNLHNIPTRTQTGDLLRRAFIAAPGNIFIDGDLSQIEWRLPAHFCGDARMCQILCDGLDIYTELANAIGVDRGFAKTMALAINYGAGVRKVAFILKVSENEAAGHVYNYRQTFPTFFKWKDSVSNQQDSITTLMGRKIKPEDSGLNVPYMVQGSAADIIKKIMLTCEEEGLIPLLQIHDELLFEVDNDRYVDELAAKVKHIMESVVTLKVPLKAEVGIGETWQAAKG